MRSVPEVLAKKIETGEELDEKERQHVSRLVMAVGQQFFEKTGSMFICGYTGHTESDGLPEYVHICPTFGADVIRTYQKVPVKNTVEPNSTADIRFK